MALDPAIEEGDAGDGPDGGDFLRPDRRHNAFYGEILAQRDLGPALFVTAEVKPPCFAYPTIGAWKQAERSGCPSLCPQASASHRCFYRGVGCHGDSLRDRPTRRIVW